MPFSGQKHAICVQKAVRKVSVKKQIFPCTKPKIDEANGKHDVFSLNSNLSTPKFGHESQTMTTGNQNVVNMTKTSVNGTITKPFCTENERLGMQREVQSSEFKVQSDFDSKSSL